MNSLRLRLDLLRQRYGWLPLVALGLTVLAAWLQGMAIPAQRSRADALQERLAALAAEAGRSKADSDAALPLIQRRYGAFRSHLADKAALPDLVRIFFREAGKTGLTLQEMTYELKSDSGDDYLAYHVNVPVKGPYGLIHQFAEGVLLGIPAAALEDIAFKRETAGSASTEARLHFVIYLKAGG